MEAKKAAPRIYVLRFAIIIVVCVMLAIILMPYVWMVLTSFKSTSEIMSNPGKIIPIDWTLSGYYKVLTGSPFFKWLQNSVIVTASVTVIVLFTSSITGYIFAKYHFKGKEFLFWIILVTMMVPFTVTMIPNFLLINELGLHNTLGALIVPMMVSGFGIFLCRQFCEDIPDSLCEAAKIDGAGDFYIYWKIILPNLGPCLGALAIFTFLESWNDYLRPLIMLESMESMTLPVALSYFTNSHYNDYSSIMAAAALIMIPVTVVFLVLQKYFIKGISITGMK